MASKEDNSNLYRVLQRGDRCIDAAHPTAIVLVGLTRAGKSTTFNWVLGKQLIGVGDEIEAHYQNVFDDLETAVLGDTFTSVTLCPNVVQLDREKAVTLIDMAGYKDKRDYVGVLGVSYFMKAVFQRVRRVKFLVVINEHKLIESSGDGIINTFLGFIKMFNSHLFSPQIREQLYASISVVITKSQNAHKHQAYLRRVSRILRDPKLIVEDKEQLISLLDYIIDQNRIEDFSLATPDKNAPRCTMLSRFDGMGWKFFDLDAAEKIIGEVVSLPFSKDFEGLKEDQKRMFDQVIEARVASYIDFSKILNTLIRSIESAWDNCLDYWQINGQLSLTLSPYEQLQVHINDFLEQNDFYNSEERVTPQLKIEYPKLNLVDTLRQVLKIYEIIDEIGDQQNSFLVNMKAYSRLFGQLIDCMMPFMASKAGEELLLRLTFIVKRGFREFSKLYQLNPDTIHDVSQKMKDNTNLIFEESRKQFMERFIKHIDNALLPLLFPSIDQLQQYESFFNDYESQYKKDLLDNIFLSEHHCSIEEAKASHYLQNDSRKQALRCYIRAFRYICDASYQTSRSFKDQADMEKQLNQLYMRKLTLLDNITSILKQLQDVPEALNYALTLSVHVKNINEVCEVYELMIEKAEGAKKIDKLGEYAEYCLEWGRYEKATILLQEKLSLQRRSFESYMATIKKMRAVAMSLNQYNENYQENLNNWERLPQEDIILNGYLQELQLIMSQE